MRIKSPGTVGYSTAIYDTLSTGTIDIKKFEYFISLKGPGASKKRPSVTFGSLQSCLLATVKVSSLLVRANEIEKTNENPCHESNNLQEDASQKSYYSYPVPEMIVSRGISVKSCIRSLYIWM